MKLRMLLLDDDPSMKDGQNFPSLDVGFDGDAQKIIRRNFVLEWLFDERGANTYYQAFRTGRADKRLRPFGRLQYSHMVIFDYRLNQSADVRRQIERNREFRRRASEIDPLRFNGTVSDYSSEWLDDDRITKLVPPDFGERSGCQLGTLISLAHSGLPSVGIPQTSTRDSKETAALEWAADITLRGAFEFKGGMKGGMLNNWMELFEKALPRLREELIYLSETGLLTVDIASLVETARQLRLGKLDGDAALTIETTLGYEQIRIEALCLDLLYQRTEDERLVKRNVGSDNFHSADKTAEQFLDRLLTSNVGNQASSIGKAIKLSDVFQRSYESYQHQVRRSVSREVYQAWVEGESDISAETEKTLKEWGVNIASAKKLIAAKKSVVLKPSPNLITLGSLKEEAENDDLVARYTAISLAIYTEKVRAGLSDPVLEGAAKRLVEFLSGNHADELHWPDFESLQGIWLTEAELAEAFEISKMSIGLKEKVRALKRCLGASLVTIQHALGLQDVASPNIYKSKGTEEYDPRNFGEIIRSRSVQDLLDVFYFVAAPSPKNLFLWSERKNGQDTDVLKPLVHRLQNGLQVSPSDLFSGDPNAKKGLMPGEGRIIRVLALHHSFAREYWPTWMRKGELL